MFVIADPCSAVVSVLNELLLCLLLDLSSGVVSLLNEPLLCLLVDLSSGVVSLLNEPLLGLLLDLSPGEVILTELCSKHSIIWLVMIVFYDTVCVHMGGVGVVVEQNFVS